MNCPIFIKYAHEQIQQLYFFLAYFSSVALQLSHYLLNAVPCAHAMVGAHLTTGQRNMFKKIPMAHMRLDWQSLKVRTLRLKLKTFYEA